MINFQRNWSRLGVKTIKWAQKRVSDSHNITSYWQRLICIIEMCVHFLKVFSSHIAVELSLFFLSTDHNRMIYCSMHLVKSLTHAFQSPSSLLVPWIFPRFMLKATNYESKHCCTFVFYLTFDASQSSSFFRHLKQPDYDKWDELITFKFELDCCYVKSDCRGMLCV